MSACKCAICGSSDLPEEPAVLFAGVAGSRRVICSECEKHLDLLTSEANADEKNEAAGYFSEFILNDGYASDDPAVQNLILNAVTGKSSIVDRSSEAEEYAYSEDFEEEEEEDDPESEDSGDTREEASSRSLPGFFGRLFRRSK